MGKSKKKSKSSSKVAAAAVVDPAPAAVIVPSPAAVAPTKPLKKGKRGAENIVVKEVASAKKQKVGAKASKKKAGKGKKAEIKEVEKVEEVKEVEKVTSEEVTKVDSDSSDNSGLEEDATKISAPVAAENGKAVASDDSLPDAVNLDAKEAESSEEESDDDEAQTKVSEAPQPTTASKEESGSEEGSEEESEEGSEAEDNTDVEMTDASAAKKAQKTPNTPATPKEQATGSKTLFVGNLPFSVEKADVEKFFKSVGEVLDVRFAMSGDGSFRGFGHVEFATAEQAVKAIEKLNGQELLGRELKLDLANERPAKGEQTPLGRPAKVEGLTVFVRGFDKTESEDQVRSSLEEHFGSCGEITRISIPQAEDGGLKGMAYLDFKDANATKQALELNGSDLGSNNLTVEEARPRGDSGSGRGRGRGRGRFGDSGRGSRGRGGGRGRGGDRGRGGRRGRGNF